MECVEAKYEGKKCYLNVDYIVDIFPNTKPHKEDEEYIAYTIDVDRGGYYIAKITMDLWMKGE